MDVAMLIVKKPFAALSVGAHLSRPAPEQSAIRASR
jgi:hypothetical protein